MARLLLRALLAQRRGARGRPYFHLFALARQCGTDEQLGRSIRDAQEAETDLSRVDARENDVCAAVFDGTDRLADVADRRAVDRLRLRGRQYAHHGADWQGCLR